MKKLSVIAADHGKSVSDLAAAAPDGGSYSYTPANNYYHSTLIFYGPAPITGEPANTNDYFFIYALGEDVNYAYVGNLIELWSSAGANLSSTPLAYYTHRYMMVISRTNVTARNAVSKWMTNKWPDER